MIPRQPWFERRFTFDLPVSAAPGLIERLRGTPARIESRLAGFPAGQLTVRSDAADWARSALHPRLKTPMRLLDLAFFVAEHDDHHLATITMLLRRVA